MAKPQTDFVIRKGGALDSTQFVLQDGAIPDIGPYGTHNLKLSIVKGTLTDLLIRIETSHDQTLWTKVTNKSVTGATTTVEIATYKVPLAGLAATDFVSIKIDERDRHMRFSFKSVGADPTGSNLAVILSSNEAA